MKLATYAFVIAWIFASCAAARAFSLSQTASSGESEGSLAPGMTINAELKSSIDSKKLKAGDPVTAEASEAVKSPDGRTILPKGAKLIGHVTQATARSKGENQSLLAIQFDKAETKNGQEVSLTNVVVEAVAPPRESSGFSSWPEGNGSAGQPASNPSVSGSTSPRGGSNTTGANPSSPYPGATTDTETGGGRDANGPLQPSSRGVYGIQGLRLGRINSPNGETSVLESNQKSVHLDSGTRLLLVEQPQGANGAAGR